MSGRGNKGKGHAFPGDFIALGSKSGSSKASAPPPSRAHIAEAQPMKKMKAEARAGIMTGERQGHTWENIAEEVDMVDLDTAIENCYRSDRSYDIHRSLFIAMTFTSGSAK